MKILSWDVGIINLAYCLLDVEGENWKIEDWGIINLTNRDTLKCFVCGKNASCCTEIEGKSKEEQYYCKKHIPKDLVAPNFDDIFEICDSSIKCQWGESDDGLKECVKKSKYRHISSGKCYCTAHAKSLYKKIVDSYKVKSLKKKAVGSMDIDVLKVELIKKLEERNDFLNVDSILIENQPSMKNPKMKAISSTLYDYFLIRGIFDKERLQSKVSYVKFMSPSNKLKLADDSDSKKLIKVKGNDAKSYKLTKSLSVKYCKDLISKYDNWVNVFDQHKKKDDLADCFLQGLYYISVNY
jgi:hypothetical protein